MQDLVWESDRKRRGGEVPYLEMVPKARKKQRRLTDVGKSLAESLIEQQTGATVQPAA